MGLPRPYFERDGLTLYCADNRDVLPLLPPRTADLIFTSPPYNVNVSPGGCGRGFYTPSRGGRAATKWADFRGYGEHDDALPQPEYEAWQRDVLRWCWDATSDRGAIFYNHKPRIVFKRLWTPLTLAGDLPLRQVIVWDGGAGIGLGDGHFCPAAEWLLLFARDGFRLRDRAASALTDIWRIAPERRAFGHPAPFPVALPAAAINAAADVGLVLDPHAGVGSTLMAAKMAGVRAIGIEINEAYCEIAARRLAQQVLPLEIA